MSVQPEEFPFDDSEFARIVAPLQGQMPDLDSHVNVILTGGPALHFHDVDVDALVGRLMTRGVASLKDSSGSKVYLFRGGVSAILTTKDE